MSKSTKYIFGVLFLLTLNPLHGTDTTDVTARDSGIKQNASRTVQQVARTCECKLSMTGNLLDDATALYDCIKGDKCTAIYECADVVLVRVYLKATTEEERDFLEGDAMIKYASMLRRRFNLPNDFKIECTVLVRHFNESENAFDYTVALKRQSLTPGTRK